MKLAFLSFAASLLLAAPLAFAQESTVPDAASAEAAEPDAAGPSESAAESDERAAGAAPSPTGPGTPAYYRYRGMSDETLAYEYERTTLGGPIALTVVGGVISGLALPTFLVSGLGSIVCHLNVPETGADCTAVDVVAVASGVSTAAFGAMTVVGVVLLDQRSRKRSELKQELWRRQSERSSIELGLRPVFGGSMLTIGGRF